MKINQLFSWDFLEKLSTSWSLDYYRTIHCLKTAIACLAGMALEKHFNWPSGQWVPITIIVVMSAQTHFGAALQKAYMRFLGTVSGVIIAVATLFIFDNNPWIIFTIVFISCVFFTYIASSGGSTSYAGTLGGVTVILILASTNATIEQALSRGLYIIIGIVIALLVSRFIFPIHAREKLRLNVAKTLRDLHQLYFKTIQTDLSQQTSQESKLDKIIMENLALQPQLIEEAAAGSRLFNNYKKSLFVEVVSCERKIYRLIYFMRKSIYESLDIQKTIHQIRPIENLHITIENTLNNLADNIENFTSFTIATDFTILLETITKITRTLPEETDVQKLLGEHSFLFLLEQIIKEVKILYDLLQQINAAVNKNNNQHI
jgi:uncharacterized membrane protein YgaE (UPF0421/DUF939 family)